MRILLLGGGGREHAFAWKISQSPKCSKLFIAPGNPGTAQCGENVPLSPNDFEAIGEFSLDQQIDLVIVGPEEPLVRGIVDYFKSIDVLAAIPVIGPSTHGAQLEGSKAYAKQFMLEFGIPTAAYREFSASDLAEGLKYLESHSLPVVLKADGLAAGKGVVICDTVDAAKTELKQMLAGKFGEASSKVVIEQFLKGIEFSVFVVTDGKHYQILPVAKDYKRVGEGDTGLNTGGMGAVSPPTFVTQELMQKVEERIIRPTIRGIVSRKIDYRGFIFFGLILVNDDPYVIEYNCRMGDPETEAVLPRLKNDLVGLLYSLVDDTLAYQQVEEDPRTAATVVLVSGGYPGEFKKGEILTGLEIPSAALVFHAGTRQTDGQIVTNGGRVIAITALADDLPQALELARKRAELIDFNGKYFRRDIGYDLLLFSEA